MRQAITFFLLSAAIFLPASSHGFDWGSWLTGYQPSQLTTFVLDLQNHYRKEIAIHGYSVDFFSKGSNGVEIKVIYRTETDKRVILLAIRNAKKLIRDRGQEKFGLYNLSIEVVWKEEGALIWTRPETQ